MLLLEAGPRYVPEKDFRLHRADWEQTMFPDKLDTSRRQTHGPMQKLDPNWRSLASWNRINGPMVASDKRRFVRYSHVMGVGGSTLHYAGESHRLNPDSMKMHSRFGVAADWPLTYQDLEPFYEVAERIVGIAGPDLDPSRPRRSKHPLPAHPMSYATKVLGKGFEREGLSWIPNGIAALSRAYDGRPRCNYCGQCGRGCPRRDRGSADLTFVAKAVATGNCELRSGAEVLMLEPGPADRVQAAVYVDGEGARQRVEADHFVVACGAVETPRLLLNSTGGSAPEGLGNETGHVGRHFLETLMWSSAALHPDRLDGHRGLPSDAVCWDFNRPDSIPGVIGGVRLSPITLEADFGGPISYATRVVDGWGKAHKQSMRERFGHVLALGGIGESLPNSRSFIDLDPDATDRHGLPKARIHSYLPEMELRRLEFLAQTSRRVLEAAGAGEVIEEYGSYDLFNSSHVFGTCRMGDDPNASVVDATCRSHRWKNLLVTDASVFPSSGGGESPSLTIYALSLLAAEKLKNRGL
ncbi:MAG: GMC family oxidoreductase [Gammaproteobacteria bacterium]|nr:GMC family oxidoreductase [Gammaproteobacteria bacterium]